MWTLRGMGTAQERFTACWHAESPRVLAFARRHVGDETAHDVVAETFLVAWRRWDQVPEPAIGWLLVTARNVIHNGVRSKHRNRALEQRIALLDDVAGYAADSADALLTRREALERLGRLDEQHREALLLIAWDGLTAEQAADVLGIKPATFRKRLSRAREVLSAAATEAPDESRIPLEEMT